MPSRRTGGRVDLVGAGPGDPGLITVRGRELLARADIVFYDALVPGDLLRAARRGARLVPVGGEGGRRRVLQERVNRMLIRAARAGWRVVRLKGGDPGLFGRVGEEAEALAAAGVPYAIVPGVTAALAAAAAAGIPLTHRRLASSVIFATGHEDPAKSAASLDWRTLAGAGTAVLYMGVSRLDAIVRELLRAGLAAGTPAALVRAATRHDEAVLVAPLGRIASRARRAGVRPPAVLIAGEVVRLARLPRRTPPLRGRTILVTRAREQADAFSALLRDAGARVLEVPAIAFAPPRSWAPLDAALRRLGEYRFLIFTSVNGAGAFFDRLRTRRIDLRALRGVDIVCIGPATAAAVEARGLRVARVPEEYRAEGVVKIFGRRVAGGTKILIPRAEVARDLLIRALRRRGAVVDVVPVYRTVPSEEGTAEVTAALRSGSIDLVTFTSSSTVTHFIDKFRLAADRRRLRRVPAAVIGPVTAATARRAGFRVAAMPRDSTIPALARAIVRRLGGAARS
jgi:uroporphyrinogen III methyltransferase/synthase